MTSPEHGSIKPLPESHESEFGIFCNLLQSQMALSRNDGEFERNQTVAAFCSTTYSGAAHGDLESEYAICRLCQHA